MNSWELLDAIGEISDEKLRRAERRRWGWKKWAAAAACLALLAGIGFAGLFPHKGDSKNAVSLSHVLEFNGAYYELVEPGTCGNGTERLALPEQIAPEQLGTPIHSDTLTDGRPVTFYQYRPMAENAPERFRAVYAADVDGTLQYAVFCNFLHWDEGQYEEIGELLSAYGIESAEDLAAVAIDGTPVTDVKAAYDWLNASEAMSEDMYQTRIFGGKTEEEQQSISAVLADMGVDIRLEAACGAVAILRYYPSINYISWALNYYKMQAEIP